MLVFGREIGRMGMCLDIEDCAFQNLGKARFCAKCGIPLQGSILQGRYEIQGLIGKDRSTITLSAIDRQEELPVTVRALQPNITSTEERDIFCRMQNWHSRFQNALTKLAVFASSNMGKMALLHFW